MIMMLMMMMMIMMMIMTMIMMMMMMMMTMMITQSFIHSFYQSIPLNHSLIPSLILSLPPSVIQSIKISRMDRGGMMPWRDKYLCQRLTTQCITLHWHSPLPEIKLPVLLSMKVLHSATLDLDRNLRHYHHFLGRLC